MWGDSSAPDAAAVEQGEAYSRSQVCKSARGYPSASATAQSKHASERAYAARQTDCMVAERGDPKIARVLKDDGNPPQGLACKRKKVQVHDSAWGYPSALDTPHAKTNSLNG